MTHIYQTRQHLLEDLRNLGIRNGDGVFVHASMKAVGYVVGGPRTLIEVLLQAVGDTGLIGMPAFSTDAYFPSDMDRAALTPEQIAEVEDAVAGFNIHKSVTAGIGILPETFRTWPGTQRSQHPAVSICLNGKDADKYLMDHSLAWATGPDAPLGRLRERPSMKILLIGVGWNRCTALHTSETLAEHRRTKTRRMKVDGQWCDSPDVADDLGRIFPKVGEAFETTGDVITGQFGQAACKLCDYRSLVDFGATSIDAMNKESGARF